MQQSPLILLVEDNPGDVILFRRAIEAYNDMFDLVVKTDGEQAITYLNRISKFGIDTPPNIMFLDINLPKASGFEVLEFTRKQDRLHYLPIVVFSSSASPADIKRAYEGNVNAYVSKPARFKEFRGVVESTLNYWLYEVQLPLELEV